VLVRKNTVFFVTFVSIAVLLPNIAVKDKVIPLTGRGGPLACEMSRLSHFLDDWLTDGSEVVSLMPWPSFTPAKTPCIHFCSLMEMLRHAGSDIVTASVRCDKGYKLGKHRSQIF
jgi:hypothetical protein